MLSSEEASTSALSLTSLASSGLCDPLGTSAIKTADRSAMPADITASTIGIEDAEAVDMARDVVAMSQPEMSRWRWLAMAAPRETWRRDDEAKFCENLATESCRVTFGPSLAGVSMPSLSLRLVSADDAEAEASASRSSLESRNTVASSSAETLASAHALSTPATSPHANAQGNAATHPDHHSRSRRGPADWGAGVDHTSLDTIDESANATFARRARKQLVVNRRHHCRRCAGIFCERHSSHRATLLMERAEGTPMPVTPGPVEGFTAWWRSLPPALASMGSILTGNPRKATTVPASPISPPPLPAPYEHGDRPLLERRGRSATCGNVTAEVASASFVKNSQTPGTEAATATVDELQVRGSSEPTLGSLPSSLDGTSGREAQSLPPDARSERRDPQRRRSASLARLNELMERAPASTEKPETQTSRSILVQRDLTVPPRSPHRPPSPSLAGPNANEAASDGQQPSFIAFRARVCDRCYLLLERARRGMEGVPRLSLVTTELTSRPSKAPSLASSTSSLRRDPSTGSLVGYGASSHHGHRASSSHTKSPIDDVDDEEAEHILSMRRVREETRREIRHFRKRLKQTVEARLRECASASGAPSSREPSPDGRMARARARRRRDEEQRAMDEVSHRMAAILAAGPRAGGDDSDGTGSSTEESDDDMMTHVEADEGLRSDSSRRSAGDDLRVPRKAATSSSRIMTWEALSSAGGNLAAHRSSMRQSPVSSPSPSRGRLGQRLGAAAPPNSSEEAEGSAPKSPSPMPGLMGRERLRRAFEFQIKHAA